MGKPIQPRRAPWTEFGKEVLLVTEPGGGLDKAADEAEKRLLDNARSLLSITKEMVGELKTADEAEFVILRLLEGLTDAVNVADARGARS